MTLHRHDLAAIIFLVVVSLIYWWPSRYLPYFWDSSGYLINTVRDFAANQTPFLISRHSDFAHPPLIPFLLAICWKLFGSTRLVSHIFMLPFLPMLLISTYYLIKKFLPRSFGLFGAMLVAFTPVVLAEYANIYVDLPSAALITAALSLLVYQRWFGSIILLSLSLLIKLPLISLLRREIYRPL